MDNRPDLEDDVLSLPHFISFLISNCGTVSFGEVDKTIPWRKVRVITVNI